MSRMATAVLFMLFCCVTSSLIGSSLGLFRFLSSCSIYCSRSGSSQIGASTDGNALSIGFCEGHGDGTTDSYEGAADEDALALEVGVGGVHGWVLFVVCNRCEFITLRKMSPLRDQDWVMGCYGVWYIR
ncbi:hypothetical protein N7G274_000509 [Stereocaulon virgatum]|uniref:Secreted protein n=1 Tax=Stereocaulon virgatum TaxID=373712 RepID=A0ABR4ASC3_9LECA